MINNKEIKDNKLIINKDNKGNTKLFISKADREIIKEIFEILYLEKLNINEELLASNINNIQVHINNMNTLDYFSLSVEGLSVKLKNDYSLKNIKADIHGIQVRHF